MKNKLRIGDRVKVINKYQDHFNKIGIIYAKGNKFNWKVRFNENGSNWSLYNNNQLQLIPNTKSKKNINGITEIYIKDNGENKKPTFGGFITTGCGVTTPKSKWKYSRKEITEMYCLENNGSWSQSIKRDLLTKQDKPDKCEYCGSIKGDRATCGDEIFKVGCNHCSPSKEDKPMCEHRWSTDGKLPIHCTRCWIEMDKCNPKEEVKLPSLLDLLDDGIEKGFPNYEFCRYNSLAEKINSIINYLEKIKL